MPLAAHHKNLSSVQMLGGTVSCRVELLAAQQKTTVSRMLRRLFGRQTWRQEKLAVGSGRPFKEEHMVMVWVEEIDSQTHRNK